MSRHDPRVVFRDEQWVMHFSVIPSGEKVAHNPPKKTYHMTGRRNSCCPSPHWTYLHVVCTVCSVASRRDADQRAASHDTTSFPRSEKGVEIRPRFIQVVSKLSTVTLSSQGLCESLKVYVAQRSMLSQPASCDSGNQQWSLEGYCKPWM